MHSTLNMMVMIGGEGPVVWMVFDLGFCLGSHDWTLDIEAGSCFSKQGWLFVEAVDDRMISCGIDNDWGDVCLCTLHAPLEHFSPPIPRTVTIVLQDRNSMSWITHYTAWCCADHAVSPLPRTHIWRISAKSTAGKGSLSYAEFCSL